VLALLDHHHLDLSGTSGDAKEGDAIQYEGLRIDHDRERRGDRRLWPRHPAFTADELGG